MILPPPARLSLVVYAVPVFVSAARCDQRWLFVAERHAPSMLGCRNSTASTAPSSSGELGMPSGPSLSNWPKSIAASACASASRNPACMDANALALNRPLQLLVPKGLPEQVPAIPV